MNLMGADDEEPYNVRKSTVFGREQEFSGMHQAMGYEHHKSQSFGQ